jgi:hypothetical protein
MIMNMEKTLDAIFSDGLKRYGTDFYHDGFSRLNHTQKQQIGGSERAFLRLAIRHAQLKLDRLNREQSELNHQHRLALANK